MKTPSNPWLRTSGVLLPPPTNQCRAEWEAEKAKKRQEFAVKTKHGELEIEPVDCVEMKR